MSKCKRNQISKSHFSKIRGDHQTWGIRKSTILSYTSFYPFFISVSTPWMWQHTDMFKPQQCLPRFAALLFSCWMWHNCVFRLWCLDIYAKLYKATKCDVQVYAFMLCIICIILFSYKIIILWSRILRKENFHRIYLCYFHNLDF